MKKPKVNFLPFLMNLFQNLKVNLMNTVMKMTLISIMIQIIVNQEKIALVLKPSVLVIVHHKFVYFLTIQTKLSLMLFNTSMTMRLGIDFS